MEKSSPLATIYYRREHGIVSPGNYKAKDRPGSDHMEALENIQEQEIMADSQEDGKEEVYPDGNVFSQEELEDLPIGAIQCLFVRISQLRPRGDTPV